ncbi:tRNA (adenosine(37)-N6)-threonylcarbamoyltransferase complex dimerization subunit type 1 TsaB [Treponema parvum]|uniref:tRNA (adenosine(37)-N6)-threonylcarbamoyltransferase complex dimerization subunit type 1 TsaB n=1 Tax=Treponema parvum TaxID=138851 RepID=UPI00211F4190|nr:tRNA (adenosine(37)-N6)-threonylcarbamoyltransferase complex dimerization subunit type 1 TsaB [Treponema parvum]
MKSTTGLTEPWNKKMKALAVDCANRKIFIAAKNEDKTVTAVFDIAMKQSENLLPAIDYVLKQTDLESKYLDYTVLCKGPGSFTGLRLGISALKAIELAHDIPVYGISSLKAYAYPFRDLSKVIVPVIDAKRDRFYAAAYEGEKTILKEEDYEAKDLAESLKNFKNLLICGPDYEAFIFVLKNLLPNFKGSINHIKGNIPSTDSLFAIAEEMMEKKQAPLADYEGPEYLRLSEAEKNLSE